MIETIERIKQHDPELVKGIYLVAKISQDDPSAALSKCRNLLERLVNLIEPTQSDKLANKIQSLNEVMPAHISAHMHFVRKLGNIGAHDSEIVDIQSVSQAIQCLIVIASWYFKVPSKSSLPELEKSGSKPLQARFFIADSVHRTWAKIAVLTSDGVLYSEYLYYMNPKVFRQNGFDFRKFKPCDFSFGTDEHGHAYQSIREVSQEEATVFKLTQQINWVEDYLAKKMAC